VYAMPLVTLAQVTSSPHTFVIVNFCLSLFSGLRIKFNSFGSATNAESDWMFSYFSNTVDFYSGNAWFKYRLAHWLCRLRSFVVLLSPFGIVLSVGQESFFEIISITCSAVKHQLTVSCNKPHKIKYQL